MVVIDFLQLFVLQIVDVLDFEMLFVECKVEFVVFYLKDEQEVVICMLELEFEFVIKLLQENVYCELFLCQCINEVVQVVMVVYVMGGDFDYFVVNYNVKCLMVIFVDDDVVLFVVVVMESDEVLCLCVFVVFEGFFVVGLIVVYEFYV